MAKDKKSINLLPTLFKTDKNSKFLSATIDQLIQAPQLERISGWVGSKDTKTYNPSTDYYIPETSKLRTDYKLEPAVIIKTPDQKIKKTIGYDDLINQIKFDGGNTNKLDRLFDPEYYTYDPHIDWDKFVNYDQYYWVSVGPTNVAVAGLQKTAVSKYTISETKDKKNFVFTPDGLTTDPLITLYKGLTYEFNIRGYDTEEASRKVWIKTKRTDGASFALKENITNNGISTGVITLEVTEDTLLTKLYYVAEDDKLVGGEFVIKAVQENSKIDVEKEILGKASFTSGNGVTFSNGLIVRFIGDVYPKSYRYKTFVVEGVGDKIQLIDLNTLETPEAYSGYYNENFDGSSFDEYPFDNFATLPLDPEYITINRASIDRNPWSRYNRWFHKDVIIQSAKYNNVEPELDQTKRAVRPIIEFKPNLQLYNFGNVAKPNVQHIDTITTDAFSTVEGQYGYYVDGVALEENDRIIFSEDTDPAINGKTYIVNFSIINGESKISLNEADDVDPLENDAVLITKGTINQGTCWRYATIDGVSKWVKAQQKETLNQAPRFEIFDSSEHSYSDTTYYQSDFAGCKVFSYEIGTGSNDPVLGFPLKYKSVANQSYYLFKNYFTTDYSTVVVNEETYQLPTNLGFIKVNKNKDEYSYVNVWTRGKTYQIPIIQYQVIQESTTNIEITAVDNPGYQTIKVEVLLNDERKFVQTDYYLYAIKNRYFVTFNSSLSVNDRLLLKLYTDAKPSDTGYYETSIGFTNNPLNGPISSFTLAELTDHAETMANSHPDFLGKFFGSNNIRDISNFNQYGTRLISNKNPAAFAGYFIGDKENNILHAIRRVSQQYEQFKLGLIKGITGLSGNYTPSEALDIVLHNMNINKDVNFPYSYSDMVAYGKGVDIRTWTVTDIRNVNYYLTKIFNPNVLSLRSVLVYHTDATTEITTQLIHGVDYIFDSIDPVVTILRSLSVNDTIVVKDYSDTSGCYVPLTPSKLGLYPKFVPEIYQDDTYADESQLVIQGHDGSITLAYGDYRDGIILEFERRVYNNIKSNYNPDLFNIHDVLPGAFRNNRYSYAEISSILKPDFLKWAGFYGFDYELNDTVTTDPKTFNFKSANNPLTNRPLPGNWRGMYKYFFDTDRPHTHPWEMLGFPSKPLWWESIYGPAPYTRGNLLLWQDLEAGLINDPESPTVITRYVRPGLTSIIPVDDDGNLLDPATAGIAQNLNSYAIENSWMFGDVGPTEAAWRRSSIWPFAMQILMALTKPAKYCSEMYDVSRMSKNLAEQYVYNGQEFISPENLKIYSHTVNRSITLTSGYSAILVEINLQKNRNYISDLKNDLSNFNLQLMNKVGGFVNKNKLEIIIDSVNPSSTNPGVSLPPEDYELFLNQSSPIKSIGLSGIIVERTISGYVLRGYDKSYPFFNCLMPSTTTTDPAFTVGGKTEPYITWKPSETDIDRLSSPTAVTPDGQKYYQKGQLVFHNNLWFRVTVSHASGKTFNNNNFVRLPSAPRIGGVTVQKPSKFETKITTVPYGKEFYTLQDLYNTIIGYGKWLESQGLILDEYASDLGEVIDWNFTAKEVLFWSSQNWAAGSVITASPFSNSLKITSTDSVVDSIIDLFYEYSILKADGQILDKNYITTVREDGVFSIKTLNTQDGIYFARLNFVQKEHAIVFNNYSLFGDAIYDVESGYRQRRIKLIGFRTANWNGDLYSPGFIYDEATIVDWSEYTDYSIGEVVRYAGNYYAALTRVDGSSTFNFTNWRILGEKPIARLLPNIDYKINQFEDFYSLDIDNFDTAQQKMSQHLIGYTPRNYLDNIFVDQISQYKFYQGFIKEKGTRNSIEKLSKASRAVLKGNIDYTEEWAFRIGSYGSYSTQKNIEINLNETTFKENPQIVKFVDSIPTTPNEVIIYQTPDSVVIKPEDYSSTPFVVTPIEDKDQLIKLPYAGYVRGDDITATAYNKSSLLTISNNRSINEGDTIWVGYREDGEWDVYRYSNTKVRVVSAAVLIPSTTIILTTNYNHSLNVGDIISISQLDKDINGVYSIKEVPALNRFVVSSSLVAVSSTLNPGIGLLFKFASSRFSNFDNLLNYKFLTDLKEGEKVWIDDAGEGKWGVFEKVNAYTESVMQSTIDNYTKRKNEQYGYRVAGSRDSLKWAISSIKFYRQSTGYGKVYVYRRTGLEDTPTLLNAITLNNVNELTYTVQTAPVGFGKSLLIDSDNDLIITSAPEVGQVKSMTTGDVRLVFSTNTPTSLYQQGVVKIDKINFSSAEIESSYVLSSREPQSYAQFGYNIQQIPGSLIISSPGQDSSRGAVHIIDYAVVDTSITFTKPEVDRLPTDALSLGTYAKFGQTISASQTNGFIAVGAPGYNGGEGAVFVYQNKTLIQTIDYASLFGIVSLRLGDGFASRVLLDTTGSYLFISAPYSNEGLDKNGKVLVMKWSADESKYLLVQLLTAPYSNIVSNFGSELSIETAGDTLVVSANGSLSLTTFDDTNGLASVTKTLSSTTTSSLASGLVSVAGRMAILYNEDTTATNVLRNVTANPTTFDSNTTVFRTALRQKGSVYLFNKYSEKYVFGQELTSAVTSISDEAEYGSSIFATDGLVAVGAPNIDPSQQNDVGNQLGRVYIFDKKSNYNNSWNLLRTEEPLVDLTKIQKTYTIDTDKEVVVDYLDIIDPLKGKIPGIADQELKYKTLTDPAIYSLGISTTNNNTTENWIDEHVGELWWDLSTVKYVWYEQGDSEFRRNNWNSTFPGSTIDIYEWVRTTYLPSQWSAMADTNEGLVQGMSGQPKYPDNSVISVKQIFNPVSQSFSNVYYYWVKNKTTIPSIDSRRLSAFNVASAIANPRSFGINYTAFISNDALMLANTKTSLREKSINLAIEMDDINSEINKHTEWLLVQEGTDRSLPSEKLFSKVIDSLLGRDSLGNPVPDPNLPARLRYGVEYRPRQSIFANRLEALRIFVEYTNNILIDNLITDNYSLTNLNAQEEIPNINLGTYDVLVEDLIERDTVSTRFAKPAYLSCTIENGKITNVIIDDPGFGYKNPPTITIIGDGVNASLAASIDSLGKISFVKIYSSGKNYSTPPTIVVRPFTVIVQSDSTANNKWSKYEWDYDNKTWGMPVHVQSYNSTRYWKYIDWLSPTFNLAQEILLTIDAPYQLDVLTEVPDYAYVKVRNAGNGKSIILQKISTVEQPGTYDNDYNLVYQEEGTIQLLDSLWDYSANTSAGFDSNAAFDQTLFDQTPDKETEFIIKAIKDDIFTGDLKIHLNKLFFRLVKYALTEQKFLDWAFKTSFITVTNNVGSLEQSPTYKLNNTTYYESFINETKPYHTKIRNFNDNYTSTDVSLLGVCDFDLPSYYSPSSQQFIPVSFGSSKLAVEPYRSWFKNYSYFIESIDLFDGGSGYLFPPDVLIIPTNGDVITDPATATAYISLGQVSKIIVTYPGNGYTSTPQILLRGGGSTQLTQARAGAKLGNGKVRSNLIQIKFDRVVGYDEIGDYNTSDQFIGDGFIREYQLTWFPNLDKSTISVTDGGIFVLSADYTIEVSQVKFRGHTKKIATLVLNFTPKYGNIVLVNYKKDVGLYHAVDRIRDFYSPTAGMPGNTATLLMSGLEYPGVTVDTLPFRQSDGWDSTPWSSSIWDDFETEAGFYEARGPVVSAKTHDSENNRYMFKIFDNSRIRNVQVGATVTATSTSTVYTVTSSTKHIGIVSNIDLSRYRETERYMDVGALGNNVGSMATGTVLLAAGDWQYTDNKSVALRMEDFVLTPGLPKDDFVVGQRVRVFRIFGSGEYQYLEGILTEIATTINPLLKIRVLINSFNITAPGGGDTRIPRVSQYNASTNPRWTVELAEGTAGGTSLGYWDITLNSTISNFDDTHQIIFTNPNPQIYTLPYQPDVGSTVTVYLNTGLAVDAVRIDSPDYNNYKGNWNETLTYSTSSIVLFEDLYYQALTYIPVSPVRPKTTSTWKQVYYNPNATMQTFIGSLGVTTIDIGQVIPPNSSVIFRSYESDGTVIPTDIDFDTMIYGGDFTVNSGKITDINVDGDGLITPTNSYGPEENIPGKVLESVGISVYTRPSSLSPLIINKKYVIDQYTNTFDLGVIPVNTASLQVLINGNRVTSDNFTIDYLNKTVTIDSNKLINNSILSLISVGLNSGIITADENTSTITLLDSGLSIVTDPAETIYSFSAAYGFVKSSYITVNGIKSIDYSLVKSNKGAVAVKFSNYLNVGDIIQAWFFSTAYKTFSEITEQVISAGTQGVYNFDLTYPPGVIEPYHGQVIIERNGQRLVPPDILYFVVEDVDAVYSLNSHFNYAMSRVSLSDINVYVNGVLVKSPRKFKIIQPDNTIKFSKKAVNVGDVVAIVILINHDYTINGTKLALTDQVDMSGADNVLRITTFTNHDSSKIRKERFPGSANRRYYLSRRALNSNYVWVEVNGSPLIPDVDYRIEKNRTVELSGEYVLDASDNVVIMSISDAVSSQDISGFRIFKDPLGRTTYKRLSQANSTQLAQDLLSTSTSITVLDGSVLISPNISRRLPGIIIVNGERIEFYEKTGNVLTQIKRGTFATGVRSIHPAGTTVIDQSREQIISTYEQEEIQKIEVTGTLNEDGSITYDNAYGAQEYELTDINLDSSTDGWSTSTNLQTVLSSQIEVYYQGRKLMKINDTRTVHQKNIAYDSSEVNSLGIESDIILSEEYSISESTGHLMLSFIPELGSEIKVVHIVSRLWDENQENFLLEHPASLPDKYYYGRV